MAHNNQPAEGPAKPKDVVKDGQDTTKTPDKPVLEAIDSMTPLPVPKESLKAQEPQGALAVDTASLYPSSAGAQPPEAMTLVGHVSASEQTTANRAEAIPAGEQLQGTGDQPAEAATRFLPPAVWPAAVAVLIEILKGVVASLIAAGLWEAGKAVMDALTGKPHLVENGSHETTDIKYKDGKSRHFDQDANGNVTGYTDKEGHHWQRQRDKNGNLTDEWTDEKTGAKMHAKMIVGKDGSFTMLDLDKKVVHHYDQNGDKVQGGDKPFSDYTPEQLKNLERLADLFERTAVAQDSGKIENADPPDMSRKLGEIGGALEKQNPPEGQYPRFVVKRDAEDHVTAISFCKDETSAPQAVYPAPDKAGK